MISMNELELLRDLHNEPWRNVEVPPGLKRRGFVEDRKGYPAVTTLGKLAVMGFLTLSECERECVMRLYRDYLEGVTSRLDTFAEEEIETLCAYGYVRESGGFVALTTAGVRMWEAVISAHMYPDTNERMKRRSRRSGRHQVRGGQR